MNIKQLYARGVFWPTWGWNLLLGRVLRLRSWWNPIDENVFLGARPLRRDVPELRKLGVQSVINTCEEFPGHLDLYRQQGISQLYIPTTDFQPPSIDQIEQAVRYIDDSIAAGKKVYIHCKAGRARSATVAICWLVKSRGWDLDRAQQHLLECRPHVNQALAQRQVVREFASRHAKHAAPMKSRSLR